ncbi:MAG TPA: efflux RND transporter periplasmic adaptor subunit [Thermoanaerobaculia bacterium]|nr:efflux RND transporter periplasmic adaptor subunit [Thermoanaerobaculia bacterium]
MKRISALAVIVAGVALAGAGCGRSEAPARPAGTARRLATAPVERRTAPGSIEVEGIVVGRFEAVVSSRLAAAVATVPAVPGRMVRSGEVLVRLEEQEVRGALDGARAAVQSARAALDLAKRNRARFERLESRGAAAALELDRARQEEATATAAAANALANLRRAEIDGAQTVLTAPFDAVVVERFVSPGDLAGPGRPLVRIASLSGRRVEASPAEQDAAALAPGGTVGLEVAGRTVTGRIAEIVGTVDPSTRRRTIRVDLPAGFEPAPGSFARVFLPGPAVPRLFVPGGAVVARGGLEIAWAVDRDGRVALRYVRTGSRRDGNVEVLSGLEAGERVVLDPPADLESGTKVTS